MKLEHDAFRSSSIALVFYQTGFLSYIILPSCYLPGDKLKFSLTPDTAGDLAIFSGNAVSLKHVSEGAFVFNIEM